MAMGRAAAMGGETDEIDARGAEALIRRNRVCDTFFSVEAPRLAADCREMSARFLAGGGCWPSVGGHAARTPGQSHHGSFTDRSSASLPFPGARFGSARMRTSDTERASEKRPPCDRPGTDAAHVAVDFVHPVIMGKWALPAQDIEGCLPIIPRPEDMVMEFSLAMSSGRG